MQRIIALSVVMLLLVAAPVLAAETKLGYVDVQKVLNLSKAGQAARVPLEDKMKGYDAEGQKRQEELKKLKEDLEKQAMLLSEDARSAKERDYQQKVKDYQRFVKDVQEEMRQLDEELSRKITSEILKVIQNYGKKEGYTAIFEVAYSGMIYADDGINLTEKMIQIYDQQDAGKAKGQ